MISPDHALCYIPKMLENISRILDISKIKTVYSKILKNLWSFIVFVPNLCEEKSVQRKYVWRKNDKYKVWVQTINAETQFTMTKIFVLGN